jgi:hypothetical protein
MPHTVVCFPSAACAALITARLVVAGQANCHFPAVSAWSLIRRGDANASAAIGDGVAIARRGAQWASHDAARRRRRRQALSDAVRPERQLLKERDRRAALDTRTPQEVWLGDPEPGRSALAQLERKPRKSGIRIGASTGDRRGWMRGNLNPLNRAKGR